MMRFSSFAYLTRQGLHNLSANKLMTFAGVGVLTACLTLTGIAGLFTTNIDQMVDYLGSQNETIVYMDPEQSDAENAKAENKILDIPGINSVSYHSKQDVLNEYRGYMEEYANLWDEFETDNPFKANYSVVIGDLENIDGICNQLRKIPHVVKVSAAVEMTNVFVNVQHTVTWAGYILVSVLAAVSSVVIYNTIRLSVFARRKEIAIMKYVGATNGFIRWPFFIEGVSIGIISSVLGSAIVLSAYALLIHASESLTGFWSTILANSLIPLSGVWYYVIPSFALIGIIFGGIGSVSAIRKHIKV